MPLLIALQFLTRLPVSLSRIPTDEENGRSLLWYPLTGLLIGILLLLGWSLLQGVSPVLQAALLLAVWVWLSGGLHLDGLADSADAWVGGYGNPERTLAIMKDPACGPVGVISLVMVLLLKWAALVALLESGQWPVLLLAPWLGRWVLPLLLMTTNYVRPGGMAQVLVDNMPRQQLPFWLAAHAVAMLLCGWSGLLALVLALLVWLLVRHYLRKRLGGTTGDTAGALVEMIEVAVLVGCAL